MQLTTLDPFGATATDLDVLDMTAVDVVDVKDALAEHGVVVLPAADIDDAQFVALLQCLGPLTFTTGEEPVDGRPDLNVVTNVGRTTPPRSQWHTDTSYVAHPPSYTALRAVDVPQAGGETLFADQRRALATLPDHLRSAIEGRTITHVVTGLELDDDAERSASHPIARPHPRTGEPALYLSTRQRCASVSGLSDDDGAALVDELLTHATHDALVLRHTWSAGDVVVWDNARVLHRADHSAVVGRRTMHRGMLAASAYADHDDDRSGRVIR